MKCRLCGARVRHKDDHCTQCGAKIMRNPNANKKMLFKLLLFILLLVGLLIVFAVSMLIFDKAHQNDSLLPGLYTGMTRQEMLKELKRSYTPFYNNGRLTRKTDEVTGEETLVYVSYVDYSNVLSLNRAMSFEATFYTIGNQEYLDTYSLNLPYITDAEGTNKTAIYDIQTKIIPLLEGQYGKSEDSGGAVQYITHFNFVESVTATESKVSKLTGFEDALLKEFKGYERTNFCVRITYDGYAFSELRKQLSD